MPTYTGVQPDKGLLRWLLDRCEEYELRAMESSLPINTDELPEEMARQADDLGVEYIGYWSANFIDPTGGTTGLAEEAARALVVGVGCGCRKLVLFGAGGYSRFVKEPPLDEQLSRLAENLGVVAELAAERALRTGLLAHLDYRSAEILRVVQDVDHPSLATAYDSANAFPVAEDPVHAAKILAPTTNAVAFKDVQVYPHRSNDVTIWGTPIGQGSVDFDTILPILESTLPEPETTTACIKLRLPPGSLEHNDWMRQSLSFLRPRVS